MDQLTLKGLSIDANGKVTAKGISLDSSQPVAGFSALDVKERQTVEVNWTGPQAVAASTTGIHAAVDGTAHTLTSGFTQPPSPRCLSITYGGTQTDIKGGHQVTLTGKDGAGNAISETFPAATADTAGTVVGTKAFAYVDPSCSIPAHDGAGATTSIGWTEKLGLPYKLPYNSVLKALLNGTPEGTAPTVTTSSSNVALNTVDLASSLTGNPVKVILAV